MENNEFGFFLDFDYDGFFFNLEMLRFLEKIYCFLCDNWLFCYYLCRKKERYIVY